MYQCQAERRSFLKFLGMGAASGLMFWIPTSVSVLLKSILA